MDDQASVTSPFTSLAKGGKAPGPTRDDPVYFWAMKLGTRVGPAANHIAKPHTPFGVLPGIISLILIAAAFSFNPFVAALGLAQVGGPRILQETGYTRLVLELDDLPVISDLKLEPRGLRIGLQGLPGQVVVGESTLEGAPDTSELIAWRLEPNGDRGILILKTTFPLELGRGYHVFGLPAGEGLGNRLVVDLGPEIGLEVVAPVTVLEVQAVAPVLVKPDSSKPVSSKSTPAKASPSQPVSRSSDQPGLTLTSARIPPKRVPTVVIDPGHGGIDPGMSGYVREKNVTLSISLKLRAHLQKAGIKVVMSRTSDWAWQGRGCNKACDLKKRADLASTDRNVFISVHVNSGGGRGIETFVFGEPLGAAALRQAERENGGGAIGRELTRQARDTARSLVNDQLAQDNLKLSSTLAYSVQRNLIAQSGSRSLGVKSNSLAVLRQARIPAILAEVGFGDHPVEGKNLASNTYQNKLALGLSKGIRAFLGY
jgi:N-acetylmuramoyl-L-alanine amidase